MISLLVIILSLLSDTIITIIYDTGDHAFFFLLPCIFIVIILSLLSYIVLGKTLTEGP